MTRDEIIRIVHKIDALEQEKIARTADLDAEIAVLRHQIPDDDSASSKATGSSGAEPTQRKKKASPKQRAAIEHILAKPQADFESLILAVYGEVTKNNSFAARSLVAHMKRTSVLEGSPGGWRVLKPRGAAHALANLSTGGGRKNGTRY